MRESESVLDLVLQDDSTTVISRLLARDEGAGANQHTNNDIVGLARYDRPVECGAGYNNAIVYTLYTFNSLLQESVVEN